MIKSFRSKALRRFAEKGDARKLPVQNSDKIAQILELLDAIEHPGQMDIPGFVFHPLGHQKRFAVKATPNYRVTWAMQGKDVIDVYLEDYH